MEDEPLTTSLGRLSEHDWRVLSNRWARGIDWVVQKCGARHWRLLEDLGGFPLFLTKRAAYEAGGRLILAEAQHRAWLRENEGRTV